MRRRKKLGNVLACSASPCLLACLPSCLPACQPASLTSLFWTTLPGYRCRMALKSDATNAHEFWWKELRCQHFHFSLFRTSKALEMPKISISPFSAYVLLFWTTLPGYKCRMALKSDATNAHEFWGEKLRCQHFHFSLFRTSKVLEMPKISISPFSAYFWLFWTTLPGYKCRMDLESDATNAHEFWWKELRCQHFHFSLFRTSKALEMPILPQVETLQSFR